MVFYQSVSPHHRCGQFVRLGGLRQSGSRQSDLSEWCNQAAIRQGSVESTLEDLSERLGRMSYRPGAKRRSYIPKAGSAQGRPLGISNFEDKIVEAAVKRTLEPIYESIFEDSS